MVFGQGKKDADIMLIGEGPGKDIIELGSHDMFIAEVVAVNVDEKLLDSKGALRLQDADLIAYSHGQYYTLGDNIGKFGYSVKK